MARMVARESAVQCSAVRAVCSAVRAAMWRKQSSSMCRMDSMTGCAGVEQRVQWGLMAAASAFLAKRRQTSPVRERPIAMWARVDCCPCVSEEREERKGGRPGEGMQRVSGAVVGWAMATAAAAGTGGCAAGSAGAGACVASHSQCAWRRPMTRTSIRFIRVIRECSLWCTVGS